MSYLVYDYLFYDFHPNYLAQQRTALKPYPVKINKPKKYPIQQHITVKDIYKGVSPPPGISKYF
jgi:hypothetical protein